VLALVVLTTLVGMRLLALDLDPPDQVVPGYSGQAHYRDEAAKAHEARNRANFGSWHLSEADEYGFWRVQSPVWVYGERLWFEVFGVGLMQARAFVVVHGIILLVLLCWLVQVRHGWEAAIAVTGLLGLNWAYIVYSRLALMEGALLCWLVVATVGLSQIDRRPERAPAWTVVAVLGMVGACLTKQTGLLLVPPFVVALPWLGLRAAGSGKWPALRSGRAWLGELRTRLTRPAGWAAVLGVAVLVLILAALFFNPQYQERLAFNAEHFTGAETERGVVPRAVSLLSRGLFSSRLRLMFLVFAPLMLWLSAAEGVRWVVVWVQARMHVARGLHPSGSSPGRAEGLRRRPDAIERWMMAWLLLAVAANLASPHRAIRFQLVMLPPAAYLGGVAAARAWVHTWSRVWVRAGVRGILAVLALSGLGISGLRYAQWIDQGRSSVVDMGPQLEALIGDRHAVVVGEFAAQAVFDTPYWHFYVRPGQFNDSAEIIEALGITHLVLDQDDFVERLIRRRSPALLKGRRALGTLDFRGRTLVVWELVDAEHPPEPEPELEPIEESSRREPVPLRRGLRSVSRSEATESVPPP